MFRIKPVFLLFLLFPTIYYAQFTDVINSNRPGKSMGAFSVGKTVFQSEFGVNYIDKDYEDVAYAAEAWESDLTLRYGILFEQLELIASFDYQNQKTTQGAYTFNEAALSRSIVGAKFLLFDPVKNYEEKPNLYSWKANHKFSFRQFIPAVALYGGFNINLAREKFLYPGLEKENAFTLKGMILTQNQFGKYTFLTNIILDKFPSARNSIDYVLSLTRGFNSRFSGLLEIQGFNNEYYKDHYGRIGGAYLFKQNVQMDISIGKNFQKDPKMIFGGIGLSWRFDANYNDVFLRIPKEEKNDGKSKSDKKKEAKDKEKKKKRLDAIESTPVTP